MQCVHHWLLDSPRAKELYVLGRCKRCGTVRQYSAWGPEDDEGIRYWTMRDGGLPRDLKKHQERAAAAMRRYAASRPITPHYVSRIKTALRRHGPMPVDELAKEIRSVRERVERAARESDDLTLENGVVHLKRTDC